MEKFTTNIEAMASIKDALGEHAAHHDIEAIYNDTFAYDTDAQAIIQIVDTETFWAIAEKHTK